MTSTQYNITVGHTGLARLCLEHWCYRTRTKLAEVREAPTSTGGGGCHAIDILIQEISGLQTVKKKTLPTVIWKTVIFDA